MKYHNPDETWHIFQGVTDFSNFCDKFVAAGKFHALVPEDVLKSYQVAEHIMAHSYYHYPMYDEALNKSLRTLEMAVKIRCQQLGISLEIVNSKRPKFPLDKYPLKTLITKLNDAEPDKYNLFEMENLRELRNSVMHPEQHGFGGAAMTGVLYKMVVVLNKIFLPSGLFKESSKLVSELNQQIAQFTAKPTIMVHNDVRYLITEISGLAAVPTMNNVIYCIFVSPLSNDTTDLLTRHSYLPPWAFHVENLLVKDGVVTAKIHNTNENVIFEISNNPVDMRKYVEFMRAFDSISASDISTYKSFYNFKKHHETVRFLYSNLNLVKTTT